MNPLSALWHDVILRFLHWLLGSLQAVVGHRSGSLALAIVLTTAAISLSLMPLTLAAARLARRGTAIRSHRALVEATAARIWASDPAELERRLDSLRRDLPRAWPSWPLQVVAMLVQYLVVGALYFAIADVAASLPRGDLGFAGIADITRTPADVCCAAPGGGHTNLLAGLLDNPAVLVLPLVATALSLAPQLLDRRGADPQMSADQRRTVRAGRQTALASPAITLGMSLFLPVAISLVLATQAAVGLAQVLVAHTARRAVTIRRLSADVRRLRPWPSASTSAPPR